MYHDEQEWSFVLPICCQFLHLTLNVGQVSCFRSCQYVGIALPCTCPHALHHDSKQCGSALMSSQLNFRYVRHLVLYWKTQWQGVCYALLPASFSVPAAP